jgi:Zn finger protein HypA/HybF involved in hydrogenase expression
MTISPSNMKIREVYCPTCKLYTKTNELAPTCELCHNDMLTVVYSVLTGERITGELASGNNKAAQ